ncbi:hypothetical protein [Hymenobacter psychrotolerans]|uniref:Por secretion system C-terminal sorting domain-containing protein n=1 Tax=Hymenobacter psychrotolerans DSM 18569 TaxID=1121959 RepID=A0A1M6WQD9_9BACT|nr:hypothetical protein [Hymenobacter psychrotolerans]SHK95980.1 hypothetical protein SAMN02746009_01868 [Hymenobacter psychrotolerans DSM 18569]
MRAKPSVSLRARRTAANINIAGSGTTICNSGTVSGGYNITANGFPVTIINSGTWASSVVVVNATITNSGNRTGTQLSVTGTAAVTNSGTWGATIENAPGVTATIGSTGVWNATKISSTGTVTVSNNGSWTANLENSGTINGPVDGRRAYVQAQTTTTNLGFFAQSGLLDFCDKSPTNTVHDGGFDTAGGSIVGANVTYCSRSVAAPLPVTLPVTLTSFRATLEGGAVQVRWATASEVRNAGFRVERSLDNHTWEQRAFVASKPSSGGPTSYQWTDAAASPKAAYYRLVQQDTDGKLTFAPAVYVPAASAPALALLPNPARGQVQLATTDTHAERLLFNGQGQLVRRLPAGTTLLSLAGLPAGLYLVRVGAATERLLVE